MESPLRMKVISGGQTGVDRAALDAAMSLGFAVGGWCPAGRRAADGPLHPRYPLTETPDEQYDRRTEWNVRDSDATLILADARRLEGGTRYTAECARRLGRPVLIVEPLDLSAVDEVLDWVRLRGIEVLNVAGPRDSVDHQIYESARAFMDRLLREILDDGRAARN